MSKHFSGLLFFLLVLSCKAQQLSVEEVSYNRNAYTCASFDSRFRQTPSTIISIKNTDLYKSKKVKTIHIYSNDNKLQNFFEFDTAGKIIRLGYNTYIYFQVSWSSGTNPYYSATSYYKDSVLIRTDTTISTEYRYKSGDTLMEFSRYEGKIYKSGLLLNEQNAYFNEQYLRKRIRVNQGDNIVYVTRFGRPIRGKKIYLKKRIRTDFDEKHLYYAKKSIAENWFRAYYGQQQIDTLKLKQHAFYKSYHPKQKTTALVAGENFWQPENCGYASTCLHIYAGSQAPSFEHREFTSNSEGLYDEYVSLYLPQDTNRVAVENFRKEMTKQREESKGKEGYSYSSEFDHLYPRVKTPVKTRLYYIRYTFF